jgi:extracellular elastinolytic metalloproteinase
MNPLCFFLPFFTLPLPFFEKTFGAGIDIPSPEISDQNLRDAAVSFVSRRLSVDPSMVRHRAESAVDAVTHTFLSQQHVSFFFSVPCFCDWSMSLMIYCLQEDVPFANAVANVAFKNNKVVSFGNSFVTPSEIHFFFLV